MQEKTRNKCQKDRALTNQPHSNQNILLDGQKDRVDRKL
jgi:hypothetical protein